MKKTAVAALAAFTTAGLVLAGCTDASSDEPVDMVMTVWTGDENVIARYEALADQFREQNPRLGDFEVQTLPFEDYNAQISIRLNGGDAPDIGWVVESATPAWVDSGALYDVSSLKDDPDYAFDDIVPGLYAALEGDGGELYGYPFAGTTHPIIYNKTAFEKAGVATPRELFDQGEWTWDNLRAISKEMVDSGKVTYGFDIPQWGYASYALFGPFLKGFGAEAYPGGDTCGLTDAASVETFQFVHDMIFEDGSYPAPGNTSSFPTGDTAMFLGAPSALAQLADSDFEYDMVPQPKGDVAYNPFIGQASMVVWAGGQDPELATELFAYLTGPDSAEGLPYIPPRASLQTQDFVSALYPQVTGDALQISVLDTLQYAVQIDYPVAFPEIETAVKPALDGVWTADADIPAQLAEACAAAEPILAG